MSEHKHDGANCVETASERARNRETGPPDSGPVGAAALRAEPDGLKGSALSIPVVASAEDRGMDIGRDRSGPAGLADTLGELAMSNGEHESNLPVGLDVGTSRIVVARSATRRTRPNTNRN